MRGQLALFAGLSIVSRSAAWNVSTVRSLVTFGDSFTDEGRLGWFGDHNGSAPPVGWFPPASNSTASGGRSWARIAATSANATLYNYAVSGAVCSNEITPRVWSSIKAPFPAVLQYELTAYVADSEYLANSKPVLEIPSAQTVYAIWIGTNDLGNDAFMTDSQIKGKTVLDYIDCVYQAIDKLYRYGGRNFVLMNVSPLNLLPQYALPEKGGRTATPFWPKKGSNLTEISYRMAQTVATVNEIFKYRTASAFKIEGKYSGAQLALYDTNALLTDAYNNPTAHFSSAINVTGFANHCSLDFSSCVKEQNLQSFFWFDELHPSEASSAVVAKNFVDVIKGKSKWATYYP